MLRLTILILGILGASLNGAAWAGENVRVFASELLAFESRQVLQPGPPIKYSDAEGGAELRKLLDPARASIIVEELFEDIDKQASGFELPNRMQLLMGRYRRAFFENPRVYEEEYLDTLNWTVLIAQRSFGTSPLPPIPVSRLSSEEQAVMRRLVENLKGMGNPMLEGLAKSIRDRVDRGMFSEAGARRALEMADRAAPPLAAASARTRNVASGEQVYTARCSACHATGIAGTPKQGDVAAWAPRIRSGLASMLESTLKGKGVMPPQSGGDFQDVELARAVVYMANAAGGRFAEPPLPAGHPGTVTYKAPPAAPRPAPVPYAAMNARQKMVLGERTYQTYCVACHQANGRGAGHIPDLHKASALANTGSVIDVVLHGSKNSNMPAWVAALQDEEIAEVINYMRFKFSSELGAFVTPADVRGRRR